MFIFKPSRFWIQKLMSGFGPYIKGKTLDVGAGTYDHYSGSFPNVSKYIRMDIKQGEGVDVVGSIYQIPFKDNEFDSVVSTQVFEHLANPQKGAEEIFRVLKEGSCAIVTVPQWNELHEEPHDYFRYTNFGLRALFERAGFTVVEMEQCGGYYSNLAQMRIRFWIDKYHLYQRPIAGRVVGKLISWYGQRMVAKDSRDADVANRKHTIGWGVVLKK